MEFRLNKVEMDVRQRVNQETSTDKVHTKKKIEVNADKEPTKEEIENSYMHSKQQDADGSEKKENQKNPDKNTDQNGNNVQDPYRGHYIDSKR